MLITEKNSLKAFSSPNRIWQGIPGIEVTAGGRIFVTFYSGGTKEQIGNFSVVVMSDDGINFTEPIAAAYMDGYRCYDPCLWIDPIGRLWFTWSRCPENALFGVFCKNPDAEEPVWSEEILIGHDVMMNKPTVLSTGEWILPIAVWDKNVKAIDYEEDKERGSFVYKSSDNGRTFKRLGGADVPNRSFDEHMILEMQDRSLSMFVRTNYGIGVSHSYDGGRSWSKGHDSGLGGPSSRFFIRRLKSGRILLINHYNFTGRNNLTALLSDDEGMTWGYSLLLDERDGVSYPDAVEAEDGYIYIIYDRDRGAFLNSLEEAQSCAREILMAKITEEDIIEGRPVGEGSRLKQTVNRLGKYSGEDKNPYKERRLYSDKEFAKKLLESFDINSAIAEIFDTYPLNCANIHSVDAKLLDKKIQELKRSDGEKEKIIVQIIGIIRKASDVKDGGINPVFERIRKIVTDNFDAELSLEDIAEQAHISVYYMCHLFKEMTGTSILDFRNSYRIIKAKELLKNSEKRMTDIAGICGFGDAGYFSRIFSREEGISPTEYRQLHKRHN